MATVKLLLVIAQVHGESERNVRVTHTFCKRRCVFIDTRKNVRLFKLIIVKCSTTNNSHVRHGALLWRVNFL